MRQFLFTTSAAFNVNILEKRSDLYKVAATAAISICMKRWWKRRSDFVLYEVATILRFHFHNSEGAGRSSLARIDLGVGFFGKNLKKRKKYKFVKWTYNNWYSKLIKKELSQRVIHKEGLASNPANGAAGCFFVLKIYKIIILRLKKCSKLVIKVKSSIKLTPFLIMPVITLSGVYRM